MSERLRSFIAVKAPPQVAERLRAAQDRLRDAADGWKWVRADSFHFTLKFLGDVQGQHLEKLWEAVRQNLGGMQAFPIRLRGVGAFPDAGAPRVIWAGVEDGAEQLAALAARVEEACTAQGFEPERRPFRAHLTLGRARRQARSSALESAVAELGDLELGEARVDRALLVKSELTRSGPIYTILEEALLEDGDRA